MSYTLSVFSNLRNQYPNWQDFRAFLESEEGGKLRVVDQGDYAIIRYVKGVSALNDVAKPWVAWFRSVIWNPTIHLPVCIAPRKAFSSEISADSSLVVEEFLEGVMVNGFVKGDEMSWSTRSTVGANTGFYGKKSFAEMIEEALKERNYQNGDLARILKYTDEHGYYFASFVLQHPDHRVVQKIQKPSLTLIHLGKIDTSGNVTLFPSAETWPDALQTWAVKSYPVLQAGETPAARLDSMAQAAEPYWQGLVFRGSNGERWRLRTLSYKILREIRGKESAVEDRFARLRLQNMIRLYTQNWPEEAQAFTDLELRVRELTAEIYKEYCAHHKEKSKAFMDIPVAYRTPVYELHGIYLNALRPKNVTLKMPVVIHYVNTMNPEKLGELLRRTKPVPVF
jgi:hypothetical protein